MLKNKKIQIKIIGCTKRSIYYNEILLTNEINVIKIIKIIKDSKTAKKSKKFVKLTKYKFINNKQHQRFKLLQSKT